MDSTIIACPGGTAMGRREGGNALFCPIFKLWLVPLCCCCCFLIWRSSQCIVGLRFPSGENQTPSAELTHTHSETVEAVHSGTGLSKQAHSEQTCLLFMQEKTHLYTHTCTDTLHHNAISTVINHFSCDDESLSQIKKFWIKISPHMPSYGCLCVLLLWILPLSIQHSLLSAVCEAIVSLW